jgi:hypothetical protein
MIEYLNNFIIIAYTIDNNYSLISSNISKIQTLIQSDTFSFSLLKQDLNQVIKIILEVVSFRTKKISFMKYKFDLISNLYNLWIYPFVLNYKNIENQIKTDTIQYFTKLIQLIQNMIENIEKNGKWISLEDDKKLQCLQKICQNLFFEKIVNLYIIAIEKPEASTLASTSFFNNSSLNSDKMEKWKVEILSTNNKNQPNQELKSEHFSYLSKRFSNLNHYIKQTSNTNMSNNYQRATLYFYKSPLYLSKYKDCNVKCLSTITVREFNDRIFLSTNGSSQSLLYEIFIELNGIDLKNIRKIFIYGVIDDTYSKKFVGFAFRNSKHFDEIACKKRFIEK